MIFVVESPVKSKNPKKWGGGRGPAATFFGLGAKVLKFGVGVGAPGLMVWEGLKSGVVVGGGLEN